jgi:2Fe-2S ferredoxin
MPRIHFVNQDVTCEVPEGTTILRAALTNGIEIEMDCGGLCNCCTCKVEIIEGIENVSEMRDDEDDMLDEEKCNRTENSRLSCQVKVYGNIKVKC